MAKRGRPRKSGARYADGKLRKPTLEQLKEASAAQYRENMAQAAAQPHRRGARDPLSPKLADALGRFCEALRLRDELHDAGQEFGHIVRSWRAAKGVPESVRRDATGTGRGPSDETVDRWWREIERVEGKLREHGQITLLAARSLCVDDCDISPEVHEDAVVGLRVVARELGRWQDWQHPFVHSRAAA
jgi:hypothetical protein